MPADRHTELDNMGCTCHSSGFDEDCPRHGKNTEATPPETETGWLLEKNPETDAGHHQYICVENGMLQWTRDHLKALRLARRADADALCEIVEDCWQVAEHMWCGDEEFMRTPHTSGTEKKDASIYVQRS